MKRVVMNFDADVWRQLKIRAAEDGTTITALVIEGAKKMLALPKRGGKQS